MTVRNFGREQVATLALAAAMLAAPAPARAQDSGTSSRPIDFRLPPPADEGRTPGVQGPSDNGLPPVAPGERRGQPTPTPAPAPTQPVTPPRVAPTQPATATPVPAPTRQGTPAAAAPRTAAPETASPVLPPTTDNPVLPQPETAAPPAATTTDTAPVTADETPVAAAPANAPSGTPVWAWVLAALAAAGAGFWYWRRRAAPAGPAVDEAPQTPGPAPAAPVQRAASPASPKPAVPTQRATPRPAAPPPAPAPLAPPDRPPPSPLVTRPSAEKRAIIGMALDIRSIRFAPDHVAVGFALHLVNQGPTAATGLMVRIALNQGSAMAEPVLARFFDGAGGSVLRDDMMLAPGAGEELSTEVMLPRAAIEPLMIGGKPMLVPVVAFDVTYHWDGEGDAFGQNAGSFVLGREQGTSGSEKLTPLALDRASYTVDRPAARATAIKRTQ
jgi:hypothetical protein